MSEPTPRAIPTRRGVIVSCQARADNPLHGPHFMAAMAVAAAQGGAIGIRANGPRDLHAIRAAVELPLIGLYKRALADTPVQITPDLVSARAVAAAGADIIAVDATDRPRPGGPVARFLPQVKAATGLPLLADVATADEGVAAERAGADYVATTLSGYTGSGPPPLEPDLELIAELAARLRVPVIAEGRFWAPEQVARAFALGAAAVVIGTAITNPREITRRFVAATPPP